jgi:hypothetical protein
MRGVPLPGRIGHTCGVPQQPAVRAIPFSLPRSPCYAASLSPLPADQPTSCREPSKSTSRRQHAISRTCPCTQSIPSLPSARGQQLRRATSAPSLTSPPPATASSSTACLRMLAALPSRKPFMCFAPGKANERTLWRPDRILCVRFRWRFVRDRSFAKMIPHFFQITKWPYERSV